MTGPKPAAAPLDLKPWIEEYLAFMQATGYAAGAIAERRRHLQCLERFLQSKGMSLEEFQRRHVAGWLRYRLRHNRFAKPSPGSRRRNRFGPAHHLDAQFSLRAFLRWARSTGRLQADPFPRHRQIRRFSPHVDDYLAYCRRHKGLAEDSLKQIELFARRFDHFLHRRRIGDWNRIRIEDIDRFVQIQAGRNVGRVQRVHAVLRGLLRYLFSQGRLQRDWSPALRSPRRYRLSRTPRPLAPEQVLAVLAGVDRGKPGGKRDFAVLLLAASLGLRCGEIASLRLQDLDWRQQAVRFEQPKTGRFLLLPLSRPLIGALADYLKGERPAQSPFRHVFLSLKPPCGPLKPGSVAALIGRRMRRAGIRAGGHRLRHAFASEMLRAGTPYPMLQELLGHRRYSSTQIYTKIDLSQLRDVADSDANDC